MCVICISERGVRQPDVDTMQAMWNRNSHGAGYMYQRNGEVIVKKGFMTFKDFCQAVENEHFTAEDPVVYHFRISTQGGINPQMTQPFFFTRDLERTKVLCARTRLGICHNGIIPVTTFSDREYSDTAHFIAEYLPGIISCVRDIYRPEVQEKIKDLIQSKMAFLDCKGTVTTVGNFITESDGLIYSNSSYKFYSVNPSIFRDPIAV